MKKRQRKKNHKKAVKAFFEVMVMASALHYKIMMMNQQNKPAGSIEGGVVCHPCMKSDVPMVNFRGQDFSPVGDIEIITDGRLDMKGEITGLTVVSK